MDPGDERDQGVWTSERVYRALIRAYPQEVRRRYAEEMVGYFGDLCREEWHSRGAEGMVLLWARTLPDLLFNVLKERGNMLLMIMSAHPPKTLTVLLSFAVILGVVSLYLPPRHVAHTQVRVNLKPQSESLSLREITELAQYGNSRPVAEEVIEALDLQMEPDELRRNLYVGSIFHGSLQDPRGVSFRYGANDKREAKMVAREAASVVASHVAKNRSKETIYRKPATAVLRPPGIHLMYALSGVLLLCAMLASGLPRLWWSRVDLDLPWRAGRRELNPSEAENLKEAELLLALGRCGPLSAAGVVHATSLSREEAEQMLDALTIMGRMQVAVEHSRLLYAPWEHDAPL